MRDAVMKIVEEEDLEEWEEQLEFFAVLSSESLVQLAIERGFLCVYVNGARLIQRQAPEFFGLQVLFCSEDCSLAIPAYDIQTAEDRVQNAHTTHIIRARINSAYMIIQCIYSINSI